MEENTVIGSYHKVHYIEFSCILSYGTWYVVCLDMAVIG